MELFDAEGRCLISDADLSLSESVVRLKENAFASLSRAEIKGVQATGNLPEM